MDIVVDTSAILAVVAEQPEKAELVRLTAGATLIAPPSVHWEIGNALSAMFRRRALHLAQAQAMLEAYATIPIRFTEIPLSRAVELSAKLGIYAYDAYVIVCAEQYRVPLITLDLAMAARARELRLEVPEIRAQ